LQGKDKNKKTPWKATRINSNTKNGVPLPSLEKKQITLLNF